MSPAVLERHRHRGERPFQRFDACSSCGRVRDDGGRALYVTGRYRTRLVCVDCFGGRR